LTTICLPCCLICSASRATPSPWRRAPRRPITRKWMGTPSNYGRDVLGLLHGASGAPLRQEYRSKLPEAHQPFREGVEYGYVREWVFFAFSWPLAARPPNTALGFLISRKGHSLPWECQLSLIGLWRVLSWSLDTREAYDEGGGPRLIKHSLWGPRTRASSKGG
jgi:hypothetical protein